MSLSEILDDLNQWEKLGEAHPDFNSEVEVPTPEAIATIRKLIELKAIIIDNPTTYGACETFEIAGGYFIEQHDEPFNHENSLVKILRVNSFGNARLSIFRGIERVLTVRYE